MFFKSKEKAKEEMVRYIESNMSPERRIRLMYEEFIKWERTRSMKIYSVKCWVYSRPYIKIVAATSEDKVKELLQKEPIEIESIAEMEITSATQLHTYEII